MAGIMDLFTGGPTPDASAVLSTATATAFMLRTPVSIDTLILDVSINETHQVENDVTEHPVEQGVDITDHIRPKPDVLTIEGLISNTPLSQTAQTRMVNAFGITFASASDADYIVGVPGYGEAAWAFLRDLHDNPRLITIATSLYTYQNMALVSLQAPRNKDTGDALRFTAQFKLIRIVSNQLTVAKVQLSQPKKVSTGKQATKPTGAAVDDSSILYSAKNSAAGQAVMKFFGVGTGP